ncbi:MAG: DUF2085 domain-containing protein [Chloroflexi bacterium]|nr:DUF2085 domain-containing protein [Chloroflexota bacterium]
MQAQILRTPFAKLIQWFVPLAAILSFAAWMFVAPQGALGKLDAIGYAVCHRIDTRSFHIGERQLPLCARCTGEFFSAGVSLAFFALTAGKRSRLPTRGILVILILLFLAFAVDGSNSYLYLMKQTSDSLDSIPNLYIPNNTLRLFTGSGMGLAIASILFPIVHQTIWREVDDRPALDWKNLTVLVIGVILLDLAILTENTIVLYLAASISTLSVLTLLTIVFAILWMIMMHTDNSATSYRQLTLPLIAGFTLALLLIVGIDLLRFNLTGSWGGFPGLTG